MEPIIVKPKHTIEVQQRGLATGQIVTVRRRPRRIQIPVKYIPSD